MRYLLMAAISGAAMLAAAPVAAQVMAPGQVYYQSAPIPAPNGMVYAQPPGVALAPPPAMVSPNPPYVAGPPPGPSVPTAGPRVWQNGRWMALPPSQNIARQNDPSRWGYSQGGRWSAGYQAPGGWNGYRRLGRGHRLPQYWLSASFGIPDYLSWGLAAPPQGYHWSRYYDDAVLVDFQGNVWDSVSGIAWAGAGASAGGSYSNSYSYSSAGGGYAGDYYQQQQYPGGYAPPVAVAPPAAQYGYGGGGYYAGSGGSTIVITTPGAITTTTVVEEVIEEVATTTTYVRAAPRRVVRRAPVKRYRAKPACCRCVCR